MKLKVAATYCLSLLLAAGLLLIVIGFFSCIFSFRYTESELRQYNQMETETIEKARQVQIEKDHPLVLYQEVDYREGEKADWYPHGQSPVLEELVAQGVLPSVEERTGSEPVVVKPIDDIGQYGGTWYRIITDAEVPIELLSRLSYVTLVRWSPQGYPIVPHVAKAFEISADNREFVIFTCPITLWESGTQYSIETSIPINGEKVTHK